MKRPGKGQSKRNKQFKHKKLSKQKKQSKATRKRQREATIVFMTKTGERKMATLTAVPGGFTVTGAHRIVGNLTVFTPAMPTTKTCTFKVEFDPAAATPPKAMGGTIMRDLPGGTTESNGIVVSATTAAEVVLPLGVFSGRRVSYMVTDNAFTGRRILTLRIRSLDGYGLNEPWRLEIAITVGPADVADFGLKVAGTGMTIDSVDVTP